MLQLSQDPTFQYELLRTLGVTRDRGADVGEVLSIAPKIISGDFESWYQNFNRLAERVRASVEGNAGRHPVSSRNAMFRAATYFRAADFFLHGNPDDPRIRETWTNATACFNCAISLLDVPAQRMEIDAGDFRIPAVFYRPYGNQRPRPTLILINGFDGSQEEMLHVIGFAALERGFNVLTCEGPGQPTVLRGQGLGFIGEWERVVTPVVTHCLRLASVDPGAITLLGYSFGGFLAPRAAAFENRLAAVVCVDGIFDVYQSFSSALSLEMRRHLAERKVDELNRAIEQAKLHNTHLRWAVEHGCWAFRTDSPYEFLERTRNMSMRNIAWQIECPVLVCEATDDRFFAGQPQLLAAAIGEQATYRKLTAADSAGEHCHVGANDVLSRTVMDWVEYTLSIERRCAPRLRESSCAA